MWPFKRKPSPYCCAHEWRLDDTYVKTIGSARYVFFVIACPLCETKRTYREEDFAHFRKYFNVKITEVITNESA